MKKQHLQHSLNYDLFIVYDSNRCFYIVSKGDIKLKRNGDYDSSNVLYYSQDLNECLKYINNRW